MLLFEVSKQTSVVVPNKWLQKVADVFAKEKKLKGSWYFSLVFVDNKTIKRLNKIYRGKNIPTDVLSFEEDSKNFVDLPMDRKCLGEIVICVPQAKKQSKDIKCSLNNEITRLLVHGLAHLSGYDHERSGPKEAAKMLLFEKKILIKLGIWDIFKFEEEPINC